MFAALKRKLLGDRRPIVRQIENEILGSLIYSDDDEAWLTEQDSKELKFGFYIAGSEDLAATSHMPDPVLIRQAESIARSQDQFIAEVMAYVNEECRTKSLHKGWEDEIAQLQIETLCLFWPKRPRDGQISFAGGNNYRLWRCAYLDGKPGGGLDFDS